VRVKIRKGDTVEVISGRMEDKGKRGEVVKVLPDEQRVVVQGVNIRKKHQRQSQTQGRRTVSGGVVEFDRQCHAGLPEVSQARSGWCPPRRR
jgi:large subunit ribosomal protein L24